MPNRVRESCLSNHVINRYIYGKKSKTDRDCSACRIEYENNACLTKCLIGISTEKNGKTNRHCSACRIKYENDACLTK